MDGKKLARRIREELIREVVTLKVKPRLAIIWIGEDDASRIYVDNKVKACREVGVLGEVYHFGVSDRQNEVIAKIKELDKLDDVKGIMIQSPVPDTFDEEVINSYISPEKDVDGLSFDNLGRIVANKERMMAATPLGILKLLDEYNIQLSGANVVIVGASKIVGRPLGLALLNREATVTIAHKKTKNLKEVTRMADILVVAIGQANFIDEDYIKEGAVVIDVGINRLEGKIVGDVDTASVSKKAAYITPVPGGVGPMTIAMLLSNVVESAKRRSK